MSEFNHIPHVNEEMKRIKVFNPYDENMAPPIYNSIPHETSILFLERNHLTSEHAAQDQAATEEQTSVREMAPLRDKETKNTLIAKAVSAVVATTGAILVGATVIEELDFLDIFTPAIVQEMFTEQNADVLLTLDQTSITFMVKILDYVPQETITMCVLDEGDAVVWSQAISEDNGVWAADGAVSALTAGTTYTFALREGDRTVWTKSFTTTPAPISYLWESAMVSLSPATNTLDFSITLPGYTLLTSLHAAIYAGEDMVTDASMMSSTADNDVIGYGQIEGLQPDTDYVFLLYDGDHLLYQTPFHTATPDYLLDNVSISLMPTDDGLSFALFIPDYTLWSGLVAAVYKGETLVSDTEIAADATSDGLMADGALAELTPETSYQFRLYDGDRLLYTEAFTTAAANPYLSHVHVFFQPFAAGFSFTLELTDYTPNDTVTARVSDQDGHLLNSIEVGLEPTEEDVWTGEETFEALDPDTDYMLEIFDGDTRIYQKTCRTMYSVSDISLSFETGVTSVSYYLFIPEYTVDAGLILEIWQEDTSVMDSHVVTEEMLSDNSVSANGVLEGLAPGTTYTAYLYDGVRLLYQDMFETTSDSDPQSGTGGDNG